MPAEALLRPDWPATLGAAGLMSTRAGGVSAAPFDTLNLRWPAERDDACDAVDAVRENRRRHAQACGGVPVYLRQVHGATVVRLRQTDASAPVHEADASFTTEQGIACTVLVADCLPVLFAAPGAVAAAHAGWRGLAAGVLEHSVAALVGATGCAPQEVHAWLGACIGPRRFEVGVDVLQAFDAEPGASGPLFRPAGVAGKWWADLPGLARARLQAAGLTQITGGRWCTVEDASRFFSFRRDRLTGRMAASVWRL
jgi:polyphenol oxidase